MKNRFVSPVSQILMLPAILTIALMFAAVPAARAGLTFTLDMYRTLQGQAYVFYTPMATNAIGSRRRLGHLHHFFAQLAHQRLAARI